MPTIRHAILLAACLLLADMFAGTALAQTPAQPLNLQLPPGIAPAMAGTVANPPSSAPASQPARDAHGNPTSAPGVYYGDHSGPAIPASETRIAAQRCDDSAYSQPQTHGSVSMGVMGGNHVSGSYQAGSFSVTKNLGDCEHPTGSVGLSISVGQSRLHGRGW